MVNYKLIYFSVRGRGEAIRQLFKLADVEFEDVQITLEEWPQYKTDQPLGQLPVLEVDGVKLAQSISILRFLGHEFKRAGKTSLESARLDMIAEVVQEMSNKPSFGKWAKVLLGMTEENKDEFFTQHVMPDVEETAPILEKFLMENGNGLILGDTETWVDVFAAEMFSRVIDFGKPDALSAYPRVLDLIKRIHNIPAIKKHIEERPEQHC